MALDPIKISCTEAESQTEWFAHCRHPPGICLKSMDDDVIFRKRLENMKCLVAGRAKAFSRGAGYTIVIARTPEEIEKAKLDKAKKSRQDR